MLPLGVRSSLTKHPALRLVSAAAAVIAVSSSAAAAETIGTLTLDFLSHISFEQRETLLISPGSTLRFHFGDPQPDGSVPFTLSPSDVSIDSIPAPDGVGNIRYELASPTSGWIRPTQSGHRMEFSATVAVTLEGRGIDGQALTYTLPFTTESASATSATGSVSRSGMRLVDGAWYVNLVAATINKDNAWPEPGAAVYGVLSGQFDQVPIGE